MEVGGWASDGLDSFTELRIKLEERLLAARKVQQFQNKGFWCSL